MEKTEKIKTPPHKKQSYTTFQRNFNDRIAKICWIVLIESGTWYTCT